MDPQIFFPHHIKTISRLHHRLLLLLSSLFEVTAAQTRDAVAVVAIRLPSVAAGHHCEAAASPQPRSHQVVHVFRPLTGNKIECLMINAARHHDLLEGWM